MIPELSSYITNGDLNLDRQSWEQLQSAYSRDDITASLKQLILQDNINLPLKKITEQEAKSSFLELVSYKCKEIKQGTLVTRYPYSFDSVGDGYFIDETNIGSLASDYFQQESRFLCDCINSPSPYRTWNSDKFLNSLLKSLWTLKVKELNSHIFRTCLSLRKYIASQFKPAVAKSIYEKFNSVDVLDFSAGWGDRLCGFYACQNTRSYIGIDPNTRVFEKYSLQSNFYSTLTEAKETSFINLPAEEVDLEENIVDTVFTSPPYFNIERYSNEETQSYKRYRKLEDWLNNFLYKAIDLSVKCLKPKGYLIINISDVYSNHQINKICDPMNMYIKEKGLKYCGLLGMRMAKRPNSFANKEGIFVEPIWIWQKE